MSSIVWLVFRMRTKEPRADIMGVFTTEEKALAACSKENDVLGPMELDVKAPEKLVPWVGAYYPLAKPERTEA